MKIQSLNVLLLLLLATVSICSSQLSSGELSSVQWIIQQYRVDWNISATTCNEISLGSQSKLTCIIDNNIESVQSIALNITNPTSPSEPLPETTKLSFPSLTSISISLDKTVTTSNSTLNILSMLDNTDNINLSSLSISMYKDTISFPANFPASIPLKHIHINNANVDSDIPQSLFSSSMITVELLVGQYNYAVTPTLQLHFDPTGTYTNLAYLNLVYPNTTMTNNNLQFTTKSFPSLIYLGMDVQQMVNISVDSTNLATLSFVVHSADNGSYLTIANAPSLSQLTVTNSHIAPTNLSSLPSLSKIKFTKVPEPITGANLLQTLDYANGGMTTFPSFDWYTEQSIVRLPRNRITALPQPLPRVKLPLELDMSNNPLTGRVNLAFCNLTKFNFVGTNINGIADCFLCHWFYTSQFFPPAVKPPANYQCKPVIDSTSYYVNSSSTVLTITGDRLGYGLPGDFSPSNLQMIVPHKVFLLPVTGESGSMNITFSNTANIKYTIAWGNNVTIINDVYARNFNRTLYVTVTGNFFTTYTMAVTNGVNSRPCTIVEKSNTSMSCMVELKNPVNKKRLQRTFIVLTDDLGNVTQHTFNVRNYPVVALSTTIPTSGGNVTLYGFFGPIMIKASSVMINDVPCNVTDKLLGRLFCTIRGGLPVGPANLTVTVGNLVFNSSMLVTIVPDVIPNDCGPKDGCNGNGKCLIDTTKICSCNEGFSGYYCESKVLNTTSFNVHQNLTIPSAVLSSNDAEFDFNIYAVQELDALGNVVFSLPTTNWTSNTTTNGNIVTKFYTLDSGADNSSSLVINVQLDISNETRTILFAGQYNTYPANTLKMTVMINDWDYESNLNTIRVLFNSPFQNLTGCERTSDSGVGVDQYYQSLQYLKIKKGDIAFYGRFLDIALSDGRPTKAINQIINSTSDSMIVGINLPQCSQCVIDPDFSVLVAVSNPNNGDGCAEGSSSQSPGGLRVKGQPNWLVPVVVVVSVVGALIIGVGMFLFTKHKLHGRRVGDVIKGIRMSRTVAVKRNSQAYHS
ncbi:hypothetical protein SAMD00019534_077370 [Acytostelium subglobosum LB1]|uniref:hypothetical protein n=1 Tax=Acytostelium subglobosum LB1 TaxID=1410327 RepID=UPI000644EB04|nr:hypothetical protein SAMD00019534_077370 [Acytostelium subglobosum LB1]GAM24562.1 hypothetical protein SAMD00019534_077370 [Acytostelium subglobosum LB1]|eukprot:XP_012752231.1 hypothetical protein SAMD00019534_077370 [Acytostelium subglobosum LB1]